MKLSFLLGKFEWVKAGLNCSFLNQAHWGAGEGNGTPLQNSCLENPMDRGAWWAAVHGVVKSRTRLNDFPFTFHFHALEKEMATHSSVLAWRIPGTGEPGGLPSLGLQSRTRLKWLSSIKELFSSCVGRDVGKCHGQADGPESGFRMENMLKIPFPEYHKHLNSLQMSRQI